MLALKYTPLLVNHVPAKRKSNSRQLKQKDRINTTNAVSAITVSVDGISQQNEVCEPPTKRLKTSDLELELQSHPMESNGVAAIRDGEPPLTAPLVHTNPLCTVQSPCVTTREWNRRKRRRKAGLLAIHTRRKLQLIRKRKRLASRVTKQANGELDMYRLTHGWEGIYPEVAYHYLHCVPHSENGSDKARRVFSCIPYTAMGYFFSDY